MKKQSGFGLIGILLIIGALLLTAGGVVVWERRVSPALVLIPTATPTPKPESSPTPLLLEQPVPEKYQPLLSKVRERGNLLVIVTLNIAWQPEGELPNEEAIKKQRAAVVQVQDDLLDELPSFKVRVYARWEPVPSIGLVVDEGALRYLVSSPKVKSIQEDNPVPPVKP